MNECWKILGIEETKDVKKIKHAYRRLVKKYHPDKASTPQQSQTYTKICSDLNNAYERALLYAKSAGDWQDTYSTPEPEDFSKDTTVNDFTNANTTKSYNIFISVPTIIVDIFHGSLLLVKSLYTGMLGFFGNIVNTFFRLKNWHPIALLFVLITTVYGIWCILDYFSLPIVTVAHRVGMTRGIPLYVVSIIGIWMNWSGLLKLNNMAQDRDNSICYMKIIGGAALIVITNLFLILIR